MRKAKQAKLPGTEVKVSQAQKLGEEFLGIRGQFAEMQEAVESKRIEMAAAMKSEGKHEMMVQNEEGRQYRFVRKKGEEKLSCHLVKTVDVEEPWDGKSSNGNGAGDEAEGDE